MRSDASPGPHRNREAGGLRRPRRVARWATLLMALLLLLVILIIADRVAEVVTARKLADRIQAAQHLATRPHVSINGWPFLTQVVSGGYRDVTLSSSSSIGANGVAVSDVDVHLQGVRVDLADALHGTVANVPVAAGSGSALLTYHQLDAIIARYVPTIGSQISVVGNTPGHARITGPLGLTLTVTAKVARGKLTVTPSSSQLAALPELIRGPVQQALAHPFTLPPFPFHVRLAAATLEPNGVHLRATAHDSVFPVR